MTTTARSALVLGLAALTALAGCATTPAPVIRRDADPLARAGAPPTPGAPEAGGEPAPAAPRTVVQPGSAELINRSVAAAPPPAPGAAGEATFNFEGESLHAVVKAILGDLLQQNYVIAPGVQGTVTLSARSVNSGQALSLLEMVLGWNNAALIWADGRYNIVPADQAVPGNLAPRTGPAAGARGYEVRAVPLKFVSAQEMEKLLKPYARPNAVLNVDPARNLIVLAGTRAELDNYLRTVQTFDVDWLAGMSIGVFPLQTAEAEKMVQQLDKVLGEAGKTPVSGMFRFMALEGSNSVVVITTQPKYLQDAQDWIERLDAGSEGTRLYTYDVKYMKAQDLGEKLSEIFSGAGGGAQQPRGSLLAPGLEPVSVSTVSSRVGEQAADQAERRSRPSGPADGGLAVGEGDVSISYVEENNALLVLSSPAQWESIRRAIERLDIMPLQVHIEAQVIEVQLVGSLSYGVSWFFEDAIDEDLRGLAQGRDIVGDISGSISGTGEDGTGPAGIAWNILGRNWQAIIELLDSETDLRILSTPSVMVRNNVEAELNVGTSIPVASTSFNPIVDGGTGSGDGTFSSIQYIQTGVILKVKPRVSTEGMVFMEISQEVSSPGSTASVGGNVPINTRNLTTEAAVRSGETVLLAGLISDTLDEGSSGIPGLRRIPFLGGLFGKQSKLNDRREVVILITPTVIRNPDEARKLTDEYGRQFRALEPLRAPQE